MSQELISRSPDLKRLRDEGYDVSIRGNFLVVDSVPYVNSEKKIKLGTLVSELTLVGDVTARPSTHVVSFAGDYPCNKDGTPITAIMHGSATAQLAAGLVINHSFSNKPPNGYADYFEKMTRYVAIISSPARSLDNSVTAQTYPVFEAEDEQSVFNYLDTASSRAAIYLVGKKLERSRVVAIVGLGGTGSYILDLVVKTPVKEIHLFDGDRFFQHNAFRCPGAPSIEELRGHPYKVDYFRDRYSNMHRGIVAHRYFVDSENARELEQMDFAFISVDGGCSRSIVIEALERSGKPYVDVGMGIYEVDAALAGALRVTTSTMQRRDHIRSRVSLAEGGVNDEYARNIQIADLNALNAALAVIKWKKLFGFYVDFEREHHSTFTINGNMLTNEVTG